MPQAPEQQPDAAPPKWKALLSLKFVGGLRARLTGRRFKLPLAGMGLIALGVVGYYMLLAPDPFDPARLEGLRAALASGDYQEARSLGTELYKDETIPAEYRAEVEYLLGAALAESAHDDFDKARVDFATLAVKYLREAADSGYPPEDETRAKFLLGRSLLYAGQIERAIEPLAAIAERAEAPQPETDQLLATAWIQQAEPNATNALAYNDRALEAATEPDTHANVLLQRAEILLALNRWADARQIAARLTSLPDPAPAQFLLGEAALREGREMRDSGRPDVQALATEEFREAVRLLETAEGRDTLRRRRIPGANYLRAQCLVELNEPELALVELDDIERRDPKAAEAIAAGVLDAEILQQLGKPRQAVDKWLVVLKSADASDPFRNPWVTRAQLRNRIEAAVRGFWASESFEEASLLLRTDLRFLSRDDSERLLALTYEQHAEALKRRATNEDKPTATKTLLQARLEYQRAGHVLSRLATLKAATRQYLDELWASAQAYLQAEDAKNSIRVLQQYVKNDSTNVRTAEALYYLAKSHLQLGEADAARKIAEECVTRFPKNPIRYQARLISSQAAVELDELLAAEAPLLANLENDLLAPESAEWRQSLFDLGRLLYLEQKWDDAERRLTEAVRRYPTERQSWEARYLLAETLRQQAERDRNRSATAAVASQRAGAAQSALMRLEEAVIRTEETLQGLTQLSQEEVLSPADQALIRNSAYLRGSLLADLNRDAEAAQAYKEFINRYYGRPETLDAYVAVSTVFRRMNQVSEARTAIAQAYETLKALPGDASLANTSVGTRVDWEQLLTWLQTL